MTQLQLPHTECQHPKPWALGLDKQRVIINMTVAEYCWVCPVCRQRMDYP